MTTTFKPPPGIGSEEIAWPPGSDNVATYTHAERLVLRRFIQEAERVGHGAACTSMGKKPLDTNCRGCAVMNQVDVLHQMKVEFGVNIADDDPDVEGEANDAAQTSIFDVEEGERLRDVGIARAHHAAPDDWKASAVAAVQWVCQNKPGVEFTTDDVWDRLASIDIEPPPERRAMAGVLASAKAAGWCEMKVGSFVQSRLPWAHRRNTQVWLSRL